VGNSSFLSLCLALAFGRLGCALFSSLLLFSTPVQQGLGCDQLLGCQVEHSQYVREESVRAAFDERIQPQRLAMCVHEQELAAFVENAKTTRQGTAILVISEDVGAQRVNSADLHLLDVGFGELELDAVFEF
jgi:hypothetical protein